MREPYCRRSSEERAALVGAAMVAMAGAAFAHHSLSCHCRRMILTCRSRFRSAASSFRRPFPGASGLRNQREAVEAYIKSQPQLGWAVLPQHYDDSGFTGGNIDRPALKTPPRRHRRSSCGLRHGLQGRSTEPIVARLRPPDGSVQPGGVSFSRCLLIRGGTSLKRGRKTERTRELDTFSFRTRGTLAVRGKSWRSAQAGGSHHVDQALEFDVRHELFRCGGSPRRRTLLWHSSECTM